MSGGAVRSSLGAMQIAGLLCVSVMLAFGQLLFKRAAGALVIGEGIAQLARSVVSVPMVAALAVYAVATALWVYLLHGIPLSRAYPFVALAFALVPCAAWLVLGEPLGVRYFVGLGLMFASIVVLTGA